MSDSSCPNGLSLVRGVDRPADPEPAPGWEPAENDAAARLAHVLCQIDEIRRLNKRLELANRELAAQNKAVRARMADWEACAAALEDRNRHTRARVAELEARLDCRRYRMIDRLHRLSRKAPLLHATGKFVLVKGFAALKKVRSLVAPRKRAGDAQAP